MIYNTQCANRCHHLKNGINVDMDHMKRCRFDDLNVKEQYDI